ncbi:MAG: AAA family ATPase [Treponema sp.]|nr:AAA family ATPase [Treponema sp.]MBP5748527.1 AAA family ATPase [Treponema sp.]MBR4387472.1 AAA family ATPase [Treponema sp.]
MINKKKYKVGLYGGSFNPLHLGHLECIIRAAGLCEELFIVISYRGDDTDIPLRVKIRWVYQLTKHLGNVRILSLKDKVKNKKDYGEHLWKGDSLEVKAAVGKKIDVVFSGSDYGQDSFWKKCYEDSDYIIYPRNEYNSTDIRKDIYGHWEWMPQVVRSYFTKKVLLIGGESAGKSTLTINLANYFNTVYLEEVGRELSELSGTDAYMLPEDFTRILVEHKAKEMRLIGKSNKVFFEDTDCLVTHFFLDFLKDQDAERNGHLADAIAALNSYDLILFLEPDVDWVQDGDRSEVIAADRKKYSEMLKSYYTRRGYSFKTISGDYNTRFDLAVKYVKELLAPKKI